MNGLLIVGAALVASAAIGMGLGALAARMIPADLFDVDFGTDDDEVTS